MTEDCNRTKAQQLFDEAWKLKLPASQKQVLMTMIDAADEDGVYRKGIQYIALDTEYCDAQVRRIIAELIDLKYIKIESAGKGRRQTTYSFDLTSCVYKMSIRNVETKVNENNLSTQNVDTNPPSVDILFEQNVDTTHSHNILSKQDVDTKPASSNARELKAFQQTTNPISITGRLLIESWIVAHPDGKKPKHDYTPQNIALADKLAADGFTAPEVSELTTEKWRNRTRSYEFRFLDEDLRTRRQINATPSPNGAKSVDPYAAEKRRVELANEMKARQQQKASNE